MGKPYSLDLRERIVAHVKAGHSARCQSAANIEQVTAFNIDQFER